MARPTASRLFALACGMAVLCLGSTSDAAIFGTNPVLDANCGGLFIPLKPSTSGVLGASGTVGLVSDTVTLYADDAVSQGYVEFALSFDLSSMLVNPGEVVDPDTAMLSLVFDDFDFAPDVYSYFVLQEEVELSYLANAGASTPGTPDLVLDGTNYGSYCTQGWVSTDNVERTYTLSLKDDLGVTQAEFDAMSADKEFALHVQCNGILTHTRYRCDGDSISNSSEQIEVSMEFLPIPEPGTALVVVLGGLAVLVRRRRRSPGPSD